MPVFNSSNVNEFLEGDAKTFMFLNAAMASVGSESSIGSEYDVSKREETAESFKLGLFFQV